MEILVDHEVHPEYLEVMLSLLFVDAEEGSPNCVCRHFLCDWI